MNRTAWWGPLVSALLVFAAGYLLWPPRHVYWVGLADVVSGVVVWIIIIAICIGFGFIVRRYTPISPVSFALGGILAYLIGMYLISAMMTPDSPVHFYMYGFMLSCMIFGTVVLQTRDAFVAMLDKTTSHNSDR